MPRHRALAIAVVLSCLVHMGVLVSPGWQMNEPAGPARRIMAQFAPHGPDAKGGAASSGTSQAKSAAAKARARHRPPAPPPPGAAIAHLPDPVPPEAPTQSDVAAEQSPPAALAAVDGAGMQPGSAGSAPQSAPSGQTPVAELLPRQGRVEYAGTASLLSVTGNASWTHDGSVLQSHLSASIAGVISAIDYASSASLSGSQIIANSTHDNRRGKISDAQIDNAAGVVRMKRGDDTRERRITGLAVALSALPQVMATLDDSQEKVALFVVGDFWVEDSVVVNFGVESVRLPSGPVDARHFQSRTTSGKTIEVWLATGWKRAPVRIRYNDGGIKVDLFAREVEIDGKVLLRAPVQNGGSD